MRSVRLNFLFIFFLTFGLSYQGYADCPPFVESNTELEAGGKKGWEGFLKIISLGTAGSFKVDEKLYKYITVKQVKDQGIDGYFNPRIKVCDYEGNNCHELYNRTSCQKIYGTQGSGAGVSAAVFIDWEGDKTKAAGEIAQGLEWDWADNVTDEEKVKFAHSPKICACSQKGACMSGISSWGAKFFSGANIFRPGEMAKVCDTCYQTKVKCAPVPLAPAPPPFCKQLAMSPPQVRIVPITNEENDYFDPKVKVIIGDLIGKDGEAGEKLDFPRRYKKDKAGESSTPDEVRERSILDRDGTTHYFETYREKNKLCTEYRGTEKEKSQRKLQFPARCFPVPPAPEPEVVEVVNENTLKIKVEMSRENCMKQANGSYSDDGYCTFNISFDASEDRKKIDPRSFRVVKPRIVKKTTKSNDDESNITDVIEGILSNNPQFKILEKYGLTPNIGIQFPDGKDYSITNSTEGNEIKPTKLELDDMGLPKIEVRYMRVKDQENSKRKMLCLSGWRPEPEEFVLKKKSKKGETKIISLKSMGVKYIKYNTVYSKESNQLYYFPCNETTDVLAKSQDELDKIIFNKRGYISIPEKNTNRNNCIVEKDDEMDTKQDCNKCKIVYKLIDGKREGECEQGQDGCICLGKACSRSTQYLNKKNNKPFYLRYKEVDCKDKDGEIQKCTQLKDQLVKANRTEVFYADKLCRLDLKNVGERVLEVIKKRLNNKNPSLPTKLYKFLGNNDYTDDLSQYDYIEIEAWGGGGAGYFSQSGGLAGMPGDYIKVRLKIDPDHPIIRVEVGKGGVSYQSGKPTLVEMCDLHKQNCLPLITVGGGGYDARSWKKTEVHAENLKLKENIVRSRGSAANLSKKDKQIAYIEDGRMKYKDVEECREDYVDGAYGAGGCIDKSRGTYSRGSPGYAEINAKKTDYEEIDYEKVDKEVEEIIDALVKNPGSDPHVSDLIKKLYPKIIEKIKDEIEKELLGSKPKDSKS